MASAVVLGLFSIAVLLLIWITTPNVDNGEIWFDIPGTSVSTSPLGDPIIAYDRMVYTPIGGVVALLATLVALALAIVNGWIFVWRRRGRPTGK